MKKNGYTKKEFLIFLIIITIFAITAVVVILNIVENTRKNDAKASALNYVDSFEKQILINEKDNEYDKIKDGIYILPLSNTYGITINDTAPKKGWININNKKVVGYSIKIDNYVITYNEEKVTVEKSDQLLIKPSGLIIKNGPTKEEANETDTHKGIVYLDPTNLLRSCDAKMASENKAENELTDTKTGCMKFYIFDDTGDTYKMILDHNTTKAITYNTTKKGDKFNVDYNDSEIKKEVDKLALSEKQGGSGWVKKPRLITEEEVAKIVENVDTDEHKKDYEFDANKYVWLIDNTFVCQNYGCDHNESANGYWTSTPINSSKELVWGVYGRAKVFKQKADNKILYGIRPVIEIKKEEID